MSYIGTSPSNGVRKVHTYTATAGQTTFSGAGSENITLSYSDGTYVDVYQNGVLLGTADYTATSGTSIVLGTGASLNDIIVVTVYDVFSVADTVSKADGGTFDGNVTMGGTLNVTGETTLATHLNMGDDDRIKLGADADMLIYHDGSHSSVQDNGTGDLRLKTNSSVVFLKGDSEILAQFDADGGCTFKHDNSTKLATSSSGLTFTGDVAGSSSGAVGYLIASDSAGVQIGTSSNHYTAFKTNNTERARLDTTGRFTVPQQSHALVEKSSTTSVGSSAVVFVTFDEERVDTGSVYDTSNGRFTAPIDGRYLLSAELQANAQVNQLHVGFYLNGGGSIGSLDPWVNFGDSVRGGTRTLAINLSAGDYLQVAAHFGSNSATLEANRQRASFYLLG